MSGSHGRDRSRPNPSNYRVIIAEDSRVLFKIIQAQFARLGLPVDYADNGFEAVRLFRSGQDAAILMDCQMPIMDGYEAAGIIRAMEEKGDSHIPIIAMTAASASDSRERCLEAGMDDYITKPFSLETLAHTLDKWLPGLEASRSLPPENPEMSPAATPDQAAIIDMNQLTAYVGDDEEVKQFVISDYLKTGHQRMESLRQAVTAKNAAEIGRLAHSFKAVNAFIGARIMVGILIKMEESALNNDLAPQEGLFVVLVRNHDLVYQALTGMAK